MIPYFGASVYDDPVVYANEGHSFHDPKHQRDVLVRMIQWFNDNLR